MRLKPDARRRRGTTLVETAIVLSIAFLFIFGIFEYGRFVMTRQVMENAAREGARWAVAHTYDGTTAMVKSQVDQRLSAARNQLADYDLNTSIEVYAADVNGDPIPNRQWNDAPFANAIAVRITGNYQPVLPSFLFMNSSIQLQTRSVMMSEAN